MTMVEASDARVRRDVWRKSSRSQISNCVEVALPAPGTDTDTVGIRDSKNPSGTVLCFDRRSWSAFLTGVKQGEFDRS